MTTTRKPTTIPPAKPVDVIPGLPSNGPFTFKSTAGDLVMPSLATLDPTLEMIEAIHEGKSTDIIRTFVHAALPDGSPERAIASRLRLSELSDLFTAWNAHSGISAGESSAS